MDTYDINFFLELESKVWAALASGDQQADESLLADDFLGVYSTGTAGKADHAAQLINGPTIAEYSLSEAKTLILAEGFVLLTYLAHFSRNKKVGAQNKEAMYISSIWKKTGDLWLNIFSQDTKAES
jgi:hypothetical protein